jgi:hypothetical protein
MHSVHLPDSAAASVTSCLSNLLYLHVCDQRHRGCRGVVSGALKRSHELFVGDFEECSI